MSKNQIPTFSEPEQPQRHDIPSGTIGADIVTSVNDAALYEFEASVAEDRVQYADELSHVKSEPGPSSVKNFAGRLIGKVMSQQEMTEVRHARSRGESYVTRKKDMAATNREITLNELPWVRRKFASLDEDRVKQLDTYLDVSAAPFLKNLQKADSSDNPSWSHWLASQATDDQLVNFLQWNVARTAERQQNPEFVAAVELQRTRFKEAARKGVETGWLSARVLEGLDEKVDDTNVYVLDPLETILHNRRGESKHREITIGIPDEGRIAEEVSNILPHEFAHQALENVYGEELEERWIREALAETAARTMRPGQEDVYPHEQLLYAILTKSLDPRLGTRAYSGTKEEKEAFYQALDALWGVPNALGKVSAYVHMMEQGGPPNDRLLKQEAPLYAALALQQKPEYIFGEGYKKPQSAASSRSR